MAQTESEVLTIDELAEYLRVSKSTIYKLAQCGQIPGHKVGKHWRFRKVVIDSWLSEQTGKPSGNK